MLRGTDCPSAIVSRQQDLLTLLMVQQPMQTLGQARLLARCDTIGWGLWYLCSLKAILQKLVCDRWPMLAASSSRLRAPELLAIQRSRPRLLLRRKNGITRLCQVGKCWRQSQKSSPGGLKYACNINCMLQLAAWCATKMQHSRAGA